MMNLKREEFMKTLSQEELADYAELEMLWDKQNDLALQANSQEERERIVNAPVPGEEEPRFQRLIKKLKAFNADNNINI